MHWHSVQSRPGFYKTTSSGELVHQPKENDRRGCNKVLDLVQLEDNLCPLY